MSQFHHEKFHSQNWQVQEAQSPGLRWKKFAKTPKADWMSGFRGNLNYFHSWV